MGGLSATRMAGSDTHAPAPCRHYGMRGAPDTQRRPRPSRWAPPTSRSRKPRAPRAGPVRQTRGLPPPRPGHANRMRVDRPNTCGKPACLGNLRLNLYYSTAAGPGVRDARRLACGCRLRRSPPRRKSSFARIQRKVLTPSDFSNLADLDIALLAFQQRYEKSAARFRWAFTR